MSKDATVKSKPERKKKHKPSPDKRVEKLPPWNVVLLDDDDHTYEYVIELMGKVFGYDSQRGYKIAREVDTAGRAICLTTHRERAELKRDQIMSYGADPRLSRSRGPMKAVIEPAAG